MTSHVEKVKACADYLREIAEKNTSRADIAELLTAYADDLSAASAEMVRLKGLTTALPPDLNDIYDLPDDLLEELSVTKTDELEDQLVTVINAYGGVASLDQILVGLYRKFKVKQKRRFLQNKLYRMDTIWSVEGKKGVYTTEQPSGATFPAFGQDKVDEDNDERQPIGGDDSDLPF